MLIKLGILGCGMIGKSFIEQALKNPSFVVSAIGSSSRDSIQQVRALGLKCETYLNQDEFFQDKSIEAVLICTPHSLHAQDAIRALQHQKHVLIEKPIATSLEELDALNTAFERFPDVTVLALPHDAYAFIEKTKMLLKQNAIGKVTNIESYLDVPGPPRANWYYNKFAVGGASLDTLPYALARIFDIVPLDIDFMTGFIYQALKKRQCLDGTQIIPQVDDSATILMRLKSGQQVIARSNWNVSRADDYLYIRGRKGDILVNCWTGKILLRTRDIKSVQADNAELTTWEDDKALLFHTDMIHPERLKLQRLKQYIQSKHRGNLQKSSAVMEIILRCLVQNKKPEPVALPSFQENVPKFLIFGDNYL